jgi:hypothetical protein
MKGRLSGKSVPPSWPANMKLFLIRLPCTPLDGALLQGRVDCLAKVFRPHLIQGFVKQGGRLLQPENAGGWWVSVHTPLVVLSNKRSPCQGVTVLVHQHQQPPPVLDLRWWE